MSTRQKWEFGTVGNLKGIVLLMCLVAVLKINPFVVSVQAKGITQNLDLSAASLGGIYYISTVYVTITSIFALFALAFGTPGYGFKRKLSWIERLLFFVAAVLFVVPHNYVAFGVGCAVMAIELALERLIKIKDSPCLAM